MQKRLLALIMMLAMASVVHAVESGPSDQTVKAQIIQCFDSTVWNEWRFSDYFEIREVIIKERTISKDECTVSFYFTVRFKKDIPAEVNEAFGNVVHQKGKAGSVAVDSMEVTLIKAGHEWRIIDCL